MNTILRKCYFQSLYLLVALIVVAFEYPGHAASVSNPLDQTVNLNQALSFSVNASGSGTLSYQWQKDEVILTGATNATFSITNAQPQNIGYYTCSVTDSINTVTSQQAALNINGYNFGVWQGLMAYYQFTGGSGTDSSMFGNNAVVTNVSAVPDRFNVAGGAVSFPQATSYIEAADSPSLEIAGQITISAWVMVGQNTAGILNKGLLHSFWEYNFAAGPSELLYGKSSGAAGPTGVSMPTNSWSHVTVTINESANQIKFYVNGALLTGSITDIQGSFDPSNVTGVISDTGQHGNLTIGNNNDSGIAGDTFTGSLDDVRIYNRALSDSDVQALYAEGLPPPTQNPATNIGATSVLLSGTVNPNGYDTQVYFLYGTGTNYGSQTASVALGNATDAVTVSIPVSGLTQNTLYHFILAATGTLGTFYGIDDTFTTLTGTPSIVQNAAQSVTSFGTVLSGTVNPNGVNTSVLFESGTTNAYGSTTASLLLGNSTNPASISVSLTGLTPNTTYHFRLDANNGSVTVSGSDSTFFTPPVTPSFTQNSAGSVNSMGADLSGIVNPNGLDTQIYFLYGTGTSYGSQTATVDLGNGTTPLNVSAPLTGLPPNTTYHFKLMITNSNGIVSGSDQVFTTSTLSLIHSIESLAGIAADDVPGTKFASFGTPIINANHHVAFAAVLASGTSHVTTANNAGIWADDSNGTRHLVTRTSGTAPGAGSAILSKLSDPVYNNAEEVAFRGQLATTGTVTAKNEYGIWSNIGGTLALVRRQGGQADGCGAGVLYNSFNAIVLSDDALVFVATLTGANTAAGVRSTNNIGIWAVSILDGQTRLIARTGFADPSTNKMIKTLTIFPVVPIVTGQSRSVDAIAGNIIYQATFTDGTTALLKAVVE